MNNYSVLIALLICKNLEKGKKTPIIIGDITFRENMTEFVKRWFQRGSYTFRLKITEIEI